MGDSWLLVYVAAVELGPERFGWCTRVRMGSEVRDASGSVRSGRVEHAEVIALRRGLESVSDWTGPYTPGYNIVVSPGAARLLKGADWGSRLERADADQALSAMCGSSWRLRDVGSPGLMGHLKSVAERQTVIASPVERIPDQPRRGLKPSHVGRLRAILGR